MQQAKGPQLFRIGAPGPGLLLPVFFFFLATAAAMPPSLMKYYQMRIWGTEDGLPDSGVTRITQTPDGFLWVGTYSSLTRFDGVHFVSHHPKNLAGLDDAKITSLDLGPKGDLWIGNQAGAAVRRSGVWQPYASGENWKGEIVRSVIERSNGDVFAGLGSRFTRLDGKKVVDLPLPPALFNGAEVLCIEDRRGNMWLRAGATMARYSEGKVEPIPDVKEHIETHILGCAPARNGGIWMAATTNIWLFRDGLWLKSFNRPEGFQYDVVTLYEDSKGNLWAGCYTRGLLQYRPDGQVLKCTTEDGLQNNSVMAIEEDNNGNIWVASNGGGLVRLRPRLAMNFAEEAGVSQSIMNSIFEEKPGQFLLGTHGSSVVQFDGEKFHPVGPEVTGTVSDHKWVFSVLKEPSGTLLAGVFDDGLIRVNGHAASKVDPQLIGASPADGRATVTALHRDLSGRLWIGTRRALASCENGQYKVYGTNDGIPALTVRGIIEDKKGALYVAGDQAGLFKREGDKFVRVRWAGAEPLPAAAPFCARDGTLWLAGSSNQVWRIRGTNYFIYTPQMGQIAHAINTIVEDNSGDIWLGARNGIVRLGLASLEAVAQGKAARLDTRLVDRNDGLRSTEIRGGGEGEGWPSALKASDGRLWFCTLKGLAVIDPAAVPIVHRKTELKIEGLTIGGTNILAEKKPRDVVLQPGSKRFKIHYTTPVLASAERAHFEYYLEGLDSVWTELGSSHTVEFQDLQPAKYVIHIRGHDTDRSWEATEGTLAFTILPYYWQTPWFAGIVASSGAGLVGAVVWLLASSQYRRRHERVEALAALQRSEDRFRHIIETAHDGVISIDSQDQIIEFNPSAERMFGYGRADVLGRSMSDLLLPSASRARHREALSLYLTTGMGHSVDRQMETTVQRKDGTEFAVEWAITPLKMREATFTIFVRDITERKRAETKIHASLAEKEVMLKEINHRVKNNLQIVSSLLSLQADAHQNPAILGPLRECENRIRSMALIHETLYQSKDLGSVDFEVYVRRLCHHLFDSFGVSMETIGLNLHFCDAALSLETSIPCGLILNELVSNALKHGFPDGKKGEIVLELKLSEQREFSLIVRDTGIGFPSTLDFHKTRTLGMQLVIRLTDQLGGTIDLRRQEGTEVIINFLDPGRNVS